jgi:hypothetical protein
VYILPISIVRDIEGSATPSVITIKILGANGVELATRSYALASRVMVLHDRIEFPHLRESRLRLEFQRGTTTEQFSPYARAVVEKPNHVLISQRDDSYFHVKINHLAPGECELSCPQKGETEVGRHGSCKACETPYGPIVICC